MTGWSCRYVREIPLAQFAAERTGFAVRDRLAVDPDYRQQLCRGAGEEGFSRRLRFRHAERALGEAIALAMHDLEHGTAGDAGQDGAVGGARHDLPPMRDDPGGCRGGPGGPPLSLP